MRMRTVGRRKPRSAASCALSRGLRDATFRAMDTTEDSPTLDLPLAQRAPNERRFFKKLKRFLADVPFAEDLVAGYYCALDRDTPA